MGVSAGCTNTQISCRNHHLPPFPKVCLESDAVLGASIGLCLYWCPTLRVEQGVAQSGKDRIKPYGALKWGPSGQSASPRRSLAYALPPRPPLGMNLSACFSYSGFAKLLQRASVSKNVDKFQKKGHGLHCVRVDTQKMTESEWLGTVRDTRATALLSRGLVGALSHGVHTRQKDPGAELLGTVGQTARHVRGKAAYRHGTNS